MERLGSPVSHRVMAGHRTPLFRLLRYFRPRCRPQILNERLWQRPPPSVNACGEVTATAHTDAEYVEYRRPAARVDSEIHSGELPRDRVGLGDKDVSKTVTPRFRFFAHSSSLLLPLF